MPTPIRASALLRIIRPARGWLVLSTLLLAGCSQPSAPVSPWSEARLAALPLRARLEQLMVLRGDSARLPGAAGDSARARLLRRARAEGVGGVLLAGGEAGVVRALSDSLRGLPLPPLLLAVAEGGLGGFGGTTELPGVEGLARGEDAALAAEAGGVAAREARSLGIDLLLVPGPTLPGHGAEPQRVLSPRATASWAAFLRGVHEGERAVGTTAFRAPPAADSGVTVLGWDRAALGPLQGEYLDSALAAGALALQPGYLALPALTGDSTPLPLSGVAVQGMLRRDRGFAGLVLADVSADGELGRRWGSVRGALGALQVGADLLLGVDDPAALADSLLAAVERGELSRANVDRAASRLFALRRAAWRGPVSADTLRPPLRSGADLTLARRAFARSSEVRGARVPLAGCRRPVLVSTPGSELSVLSSELYRRTPALLHLRSTRVGRRGPLSGLADYPGNQADCVIAVATPGAAPRIVDWLGAAARRDTSRAARRDSVRFRADSAAFARDTASRRVVWVELGGQAPAQGARTSVRVWGAGPAAQQAAAEALLSTAPAAGDAPRPAPRLAYPPARVLVRGDASSVAMNPDSLRRIDGVLQRGVDSGVFTAAVVAVARHGRLVKLSGYGHVAGHAVDPHSTLFDLASLSKVVGTTAATMALVDEGRLGLETPVARYLPQFRGDGRGDVSVWNLLTHTSGLPAGADLYSEAANPEQALKRVLRTPLLAEPGKQVLYSDFSMIVLAEVVKARALEPLDAFLARRVFVPLGMESTQYDPSAGLGERTVPGALRSERPYTLRGVVHDGNAFRLGGVAGHAGLFSTGADLAVYAQTLLNGGSYGEARIWSPGTVQAFTHRQANAGTRALGWDTPARRSASGDYFSPRSFGHTGFTGTSLWVDPERDLFVVLLTNRTYDTGTTGQILDIRRAVGDAAVRSITDLPIPPRPGTPAAEAAAAAERARQRARRRPRRPVRRPVRRTTTRRRRRGAMVETRVRAELASFSSTSPLASSQT